MTTQYDAVADEYEAKIVPRFRIIADLLLDAANPGPGEAVLEIAAGTGGLTRLVQPRLGDAGRLVATDLSAPMLRVAERVLAASRDARPTPEFVPCDLEALPFPDATFDLVVGQFTPLQDSEPGLREAHRVARPGGRLAIAFWGPAYRELDLVVGVRRRLGLEPRANPDPAAAGARVAAAGFGDVAYRVVGLPFRHATVDAYLTYRRGFGRPDGFDDALWAQYWEAVEAEAKAMAERDGTLALTWSVVLLTATA